MDRTCIIGGIMKRIITIFITLLLSLILVSCGEKTYTGKLEYSGLVKDELLDVEVDAPILIRQVEMVQYYKDETGNVELVFANKPIESFDEYTNPDFPDIQSEIFHNDVKLEGYSLSDNLIKYMAYSEDIEKIKLTDLKENEALYKNKLLLLDDAYASYGNEWKLGDIRITYYYLNPDNIYELTAKVSDNTLIY